jgi:hypothetical protein
MQSVSLSSTFAYATVTCQDVLADVVWQRLGEPRVYQKGGSVGVREVHAARRVDQTTAGQGAPLS